MSTCYSSTCDQLVKPLSGQRYANHSPFAWRTLNCASDQFYETLTGVPNFCGEEIPGPWRLQVAAGRPALAGWVSELCGPPSHLFRLPTLAKRVRPLRCRPWVIGHSLPLGL